MPNRLPVQLIVSGYLAGKTYQELATEFDASYAGIAKLLARENVVRRGRRRGADHPNWKGGRRIRSTGYVRVWVDPSDPMAAMVPPSEKSSHIPEHRLVMARHLGRPLRPDEQVHHINGVKDDNRIENLQLLLGPHGNGRVAQCADCGSSNIIHKELDHAQS